MLYCCYIKVCIYIQVSNQMAQQELEGIKLQLEELEKAVGQTIDTYLTSKQYDEKEVPKWINQINQQLMWKICQNQKPFKIFINTIIMQRKGANVAMAHSNYQDSEFDLISEVIWPKQKPGRPEVTKETMQCIISVYCLSALNGNSYKTEG